MNDGEIQIRTLKPDDFESAMGLVQTCYGEDAEPPEWWKWRHFDPSLNSPLIFGAFDGETVVGIRPIALFPFSFKGEDLIGAVFSAVMVHPDYRRRGIFSSLVSTGIEEAWGRGASFVTTMPNDLSGQAFKRLGWIDPGLRTLLILPLDFEGIFRSKQLPGWLGRLVGATVRLVGKGSPRVFENSEVLVSEVDAICEAADELADEVCRHHHGLMLRRTTTWWNWRFRANPWSSYRRFEARTSHGKLRGILVAATEKRSGLLVGYIADVLSTDVEVTRSLVSKGVECLVQDGAQIVAAVMTDRGHLSMLRSQGFFRVPHTLSPKKFRTMFVTNPADSSLLDSLGKIENWHQTLGDWDGI